MILAVFLVLPFEVLAKLVIGFFAPFALGMGIPVSMVEMICERVCGFGLPLALKVLKYRQDHDSQ